MIICACKLYCQYAFVFSPEHLKSDNISKQKWFKLPKGLSVVTIHCKSPRCCRGGQASRTVVFLSAEAYQNGRGAAVSMCILRFYVPINLFVSLCGNDPATVKTGGDIITINPDAKTEDGDSSQIPNPLTGHESLAELAKAVGFDIKAPTVPAGYEADAYIDISGELAEAFYVKGDDTLVYRVSRGEGDNSGDYNTYSNKKTVDVNGVSVELRGNDKVNVATWSNGGFAYSVSAKQGISETEVAAVVSSAL